MIVGSFVTTTEEPKPVTYITLWHWIKETGNLVVTVLICVHIKMWATGIWLRLSVQNNVTATT
jgi:hypothetical protein